MGFLWVYKQSEAHTTFLHGALLLSVEWEECQLVVYYSRMGGLWYSRINTSRYDRISHPPFPEGRDQGPHNHQAHTLTCGEYTDLRVSNELGLADYTLPRDELKRNRTEMDECPWEKKSISSHSNHRALRDWLKQKSGSKKGNWMKPTQQATLSHLIL